MLCGQASSLTSRQVATQADTGGAMVSWRQRTAHSLAAVPQRGGPPWTGATSLPRIRTALAHITDAHVHCSFSTSVP